MYVIHPSGLWYSHIAHVYSTEVKLVQMAVSPLRTTQQGEESFGIYWQDIGTFGASTYVEA